MAEVYIGPYIIVQNKQTVEDVQVRVCTEGHAVDHAACFCSQCGLPVSMVTRQVARKAPLIPVDGFYVQKGRVASIYYLVPTSKILESQICSIVQPYVEYDNVHFLQYTVQLNQMSSAKSIGFIEDVHMPELDLIEDYYGGYELCFGVVCLGD